MKGKGEYLLLACLIFSPFALTAQEKPAVSLYGIVHLGLDLPAGIRSWVLRGVSVASVWVISTRH